MVRTIITFYTYKDERVILDEVQKAFAFECIRVTITRKEQVMFQ